MNDEVVIVEENVELGDVILLMLCNVIYYFLVVDKDGRFFGLVLIIDVLGVVVDFFGMVIIYSWFMNCSFIGFFFIDCYVIENLVMFLWFVVSFLVVWWFFF